MNGEPKQAIKINFTYINQLKLKQMTTTQTTAETKLTKYVYYRTIQEFYGKWEHVDFYPCNSSGRMDKETKELFLTNLKAYRDNSNAPVRTSSTKELRTN